jgi:CheY-like chemotaxis protein/anti-sigma regulatory factor (Ser/Thr protein kinase)
MLETEQFNVRGLLREIESMLTERAQEKGLALEFAVDGRMPVSLQTDSTKLRQILVNIIGNAIKFTAHGSITVRAVVQHDDADEVTVSVDITDTGPGIDAHDVHKVFDAFEQSASGREKGGTGLGMTISRQYARMMGGDLTISSEVGKGTTAHFIFCAQRCGDERHAERSNGLERRAGERITGLAPTSAVPKILVVDDVDSNRTLLNLMLSDAGLTDIREARNGNEAVSIARDWQPDIVLMDRRMFGMDGLQATREIRGLPHGQATRIVMVTASAFEQDRQEALASGADGFISKPFREEAMLKEIQRLYPGIVFQHADAQAMSSQGTRNAAGSSDYRTELALIDSAVIAELRDLIECGDVGRFERAIEKHVQERSPAMHSRLHELVEKFEYDQILAILSGTRGSG